MGSGATAITVGGDLRLLHDYSKLTVAPDSGGLTPINVAGTAIFGAGSVLYADYYMWPMAGTWTVATYASVIDNGLILHVPAGQMGWSMNVGPTALTVTWDGSAPAAPVLGDLNWDGIVNNQDINPFVLALTNLPGWQGQYPGKDVIDVGDINGDGYFDNQDINPFIGLLTGGGAAVPEPAALSLLVLGGLGLLRRRGRLAFCPVSPVHRRVRPGR